MQELLRLLASWKGIAVEPGAELRLELAAFPGGGLALLVLVGVVLALFLVGSIYRREAAALSPARRAVLAVLRCGAVLAAILLLLEPNLVAVKKQERPGHAILLLDVSQSMGHKDAYRREEARGLVRAWERLGVPDPPATPRLDLAKTLLRHGDDELLRALAARNRVMAYAFSSGIDPLPVRERTEGERTWRIPDVGSVAAAGRYSNLGGAVRAALERSREAAVAGLILLSDGRRNVGPQGPEIARLLSQRKVPHTLVVGIGDPSETRTIEVTRIEAPDKVFQKDPFRVKAHVASQGYETTAVTVRLFRVPDGGGRGLQVSTELVQLGGAEPEKVVEFDRITSDEPGLFTYRVAVEPPGGEPFSADRHERRARVEVLSEQTRVLLIAGGPSHDYRFLTTTLVRDKTIELACWLTSADTDFPQDGNRSIKALPADQKEMDAIDVLIVMDPDPAKLNRDFCELAADHVLENGAGLWWVCGEKYTLEAMRSDAGTRPLANLLPIVPDLVTADRVVIGLGRGFPRSWPLELTSEGAVHPASRLVGSRDENEQVWRRLPGFRFAFPVLRAKPAAKVLVGHGNPRLRRPEGPMPLIVVQPVGAGRVVFTGGDESYLWRSLYKDSYDRYWVKGIRYLYQGRLNAGNSRFRLYLSEDEIELGQSVKVTAEAKNEAFQPLLADSVEIRLSRDGGIEESLHLKPVEGLPGQYEANIRPGETGFYRLAPAARVGRNVEASLEVRPAAIEKEGPADLAELGAIASASGGELLASPEELTAAADRIPSMTTTDVFRTPHAIWDTWVTILIILSLLAAEWWLRKRFNLL